MKKFIMIICAALAGCALESGGLAPIPDGGADASFPITCVGNRMLDESVAPLCDGEIAVANCDPDRWSLCITGVNPETYCWHCNKDVFGRTLSPTP